MNIRHYILVLLLWNVTISHAQVYAGIDIEYESFRLCDSISTNQKVPFIRFFSINEKTTFDRTIDLLDTYTPLGKAVSCCCTGTPNNNEDSIIPEGYFRDPEEAFLAGVDYKEYFWASTLNDMGMTAGTVIQQIYFQ